VHRRNHFMLFWRLCSTNLWCTFCPGRTYVLDSRYPVAVVGLVWEELGISAPLIHTGHS
jgi:hypothetical protein